jgi:hypothetical protein
VRGYSNNRGYRVAAEQGGWTVLTHSRHPELLAFHVDGISAGGERRSKRDPEKIVDGGILVPVEEEFNLASDNGEFIDSLKTHLQDEGSYAVSEVLRLLGIAEHVQWPRALEGAAFVFDRKLQREWTSTAVAMRARYTRFLPALVIPFWKNL